MENLSIFAQAVRDGERFLARNNFLLARRAFETALAIQETPELLERQALCVKEIIKQGRKLEQKGRWLEALRHFERVEGEQEWLTSRIQALRQKVNGSAAQETLDSAEQNPDLETRVGVYDQIIFQYLLSDDIKNNINNKKIFCLLQLGRYDQVLTFYAHHPPLEDRSYYYRGFAYAK